MEVIREVVVVWVRIYERAWSDCGEKDRQRSSKFRRLVDHRTPPVANLRIRSIRKFKRENRAVHTPSGRLEARARHRPRKFSDYFYLGQNPRKAAFPVSASAPRVTRRSRPVRTFCGRVRLGWGESGGHAMFSPLLIALCRFSSEDQEGHGATPGVFHKPPRSLFRQGLYGSQSVGCELYVHTPEMNPNSSCCCHNQDQVFLSSPIQIDPLGGIIANPSLTHPPISSDVLAEQESVNQFSPTQSTPRLASDPALAYSTSAAHFQSSESLIFPRAFRVPMTRLLSHSRNRLIIRKWRPLNRL